MFDFIGVADNYAVVPSPVLNATHSRPLPRAPGADRFADR
jgi:hypothetical protein